MTKLEEEKTQKKINPAVFSANKGHEWNII